VYASSKNWAVVIPVEGLVGRHRLGHPDRRLRWPDAGRASISDAAYRGIPNGMSGKWIPIERPPCARAFAVSVASWAIAMAMAMARTMDPVDTRRRDWS
jgi:hypothetical protein